MIDDRRIRIPRDLFASALGAVKAANYDSVTLWIRNLIRVEIARESNDVEQIALDDFRQWLEQHPEGLLTFEVSSKRFCVMDDKQ